MRRVVAPAPPVGVPGWADQTRRVLTRDLLLRAARAQPAEKHALLFRAVHLNLPLIGEVADGLRLTTVERGRCEHPALEALAQAVRSFDPYGDEEFADYASVVVEREVAAHLPGVSRRRD